MKFCEVCEQDSHRDTILNLAHQLFVAKNEEELAHQMAQEATEKRMKLEQDLCYFTGIVVSRNPELMKRVNGVHSADESQGKATGGTPVAPGGRAHENHA